MTASEALHILRGLADGVDPVTGAELASTDPCQQPQVLRALFLAINTLEQSAEREQRAKHLPTNQGKPWTPSEDAELLRGFDAGTRIKDLAHKHQRSNGAIQSRLVRHGRLAPNHPDQNSASSSHGPLQPPEPGDNSTSDSAWSKDELPF